VIPDEQEALSLHRKYGSSPQIVTHCETVAKVSLRLVGAFHARGLNVDGDAILAGALLHDIGRTRTQTVQHGYAGATILAGEGVDSIVVEIVKRHVGAGIAGEEAASLGLPAGDYIPSTLEEKLVCFSDKMVSGDVVRPFDVEVKRFARKGHDVRRLRQLRDDLQLSLGEDPERVALSAP
jgi:uncharacterized protein (TIGR00295 family)